MQNTAKKESLGSNTSLPVAMRVANAMSKLGIVGLPRNYEVFYGAMSGANPELQKRLLDCGNSIDQRQLDDLFAKHCARADDEKLVGKICDAIEDKLGDAINMIQMEQRSVSQYGKILGQASQRLDPKTRVPPEVVSKLVNVLSSATETTQKQGRKTLEGMQSNSSELAAVKTQLAEYKKLAETDPLTGLFNRRAFDNKLAAQKTDDLQRSALVIGDIDKFKALNDTYGHPFGDMVIQKIAHVLKAKVREEALVARVGGEEFALFSSNIDEKDIMHLAERLRVAVSEEAYSDGRTRLGPGKITISFGVCHGSLATNTQSLYSQADEALYASKRVGRNRVTSFSTVNQSPERKNLFIYK